MVAQNTNADTSNLELFGGSSPHLYKKENYAPLRPNPKPGKVGNEYALGYFPPAVFSFDGFVATVEDGKAIVFAQYDQSWRKEANFKRSNLLPIDTDNKVFLDEHGQPIKRKGIDPATGKEKTFNYIEQPLTDAEARRLLSDPFIRQYVAIVQESCSSKPDDRRFHMVLILDKIMTDVRRYKSLMRRIAALLHGRADPAVKDGARFFYSSTHACVIKRAVTVPVSYIESLPDPAERKYTAPAQTYTATTALEQQVIEALAFTQDVGIDYTEWFAQTAAVRSTFDRETTIRIIENWKPGKPGEVAAKVDSLTNGYTGAKVTLARVFWLAQQYGYKPAKGKNKQVKRPLASYVHSVELPAFDADLRVNLRYVSDLDRGVYDGYRGVLVKAVTGSGKTELLEREIADFEARTGRAARVLYLTYRVSLVHTGGVQRLGCIAHDDGLPLDLQRAAPRIATTVDSVEKYAGIDFDFIIIDELSQVLPHFGAGTLQGAEPARNYRTTKDLIHRSRYFFGLDAHLSNIEILWARQLCQDVIAIENTYHADKGGAVFASSDTYVIQRALELIAANDGCVTIACTSKSDAETVFELLAGEFGADAGVLINSDVSNSEAVTALIRELNEQVKTLRFLIYTSSIGTGVNVTARVKAKLALCRRLPVAPADIIQMVGRFRNADECLIFVQPSTGQAETDALKIAGDAEHNAWATAHAADFSAHQINPYDDNLRGANKLLSLYEAQRNRAMNDPLSFTVAYAQADGYTVAYVHGENQELRAKLKGIRENIRAEIDELALVVEPVNYEVFKERRKAGTVTRATHAGRLRDQVETAVGLTITAALRDRLHSHATRAALMTVTDLFDTVDELKEIDRGEARYLLKDRKNRTLRREFIEATAKHIFEGDVLDIPNTLKDWTTADFAERVGNYITLYDAQLRRLLKYRPEKNSQTPHGFVRWFLREHLDLRLTQERRGRGEDRYWAYSVDVARWDETLALVQARLRHLQKEREARHTTFHHDTCPMPKSGTSQPPAEPPTTSRINFAETLRQGKNPNPFAADFTPIYRETEAV